MNSNVCYGCDGSDKATTEDHYHQYNNALGSTTSGWFFDGSWYSDPGKAADAVRMLYDVTHDEAMKYLRAIRKIYN